MHLFSYNQSSQKASFTCYARISIKIFFYGWPGQGDHGQDDDVSYHRCCDHGRHRIRCRTGRSHALYRQAGSRRCRYDPHQIRRFLAGLQRHLGCLRQFLKGHGFFFPSDNTDDHRHLRGPAHLDLHDVSNTPYPSDDLSLLPAKLNHHLDRRIPLVDPCLSQSCLAERLGRSFLLKKSFSALQ